MPEKYTFTMDPSGDVLLSLNNPDAPFAVWGDSKPDSDLRLKPKVVTFLLSSRHLSLASPVLKTMLSGKWKEGVKAEHDNLYRLTADSWDTEALAMVMNAIHGRWSLVPKIVSLEVLACIAVIVDYYDIREPLQLVSSLWMNGFMASSIPFDLCRELVLWILISWCFKDQELFGQATKVAILRSKREFEIPTDIPIPPSIIAEINTRRNKSMRKIADGLQELIEGYSAGRYGCDFECSCMQLGALMRGLHGLGLTYGNTADKPFRGSSLVDVVEKLRTIQAPSWTKVPTVCTPGISGHHRSKTRPCAACQTTHQCPADQLVFLFGVGLQDEYPKEICLGVGETVITCASDGALGKEARRLVQLLEGKIEMDLWMFD